MKEFNFDIIHYKEGCNCIKCNKHYFPYQDQFVYIHNGDRLITYELCLNCLKEIIFQKCNKCGHTVVDPYELLYTNLIDNQTFCKKCF